MMKYSFTILLILIVNVLAAQRTETYYDYNWQPCKIEHARFFSVVEKTDSGWHEQDYYINSGQLQMTGLYKDKECKIKNGYFRWFYPNGRISAEGKLVDNKQQGVCLSYHSNGMMSDSAYFENGRPAGVRYKWYNNGYMRDSTAHVNDSMDVYVAWFDDGYISTAGYLLNGKAYGKWQFFHHDGKPSAYVVYDQGRVISKEYINEDGSPQKDTSDTGAEFKKGGQKGWVRYLQNASVWPHDTKLVNTDAVTVVVRFVINEEGKPEDVEVAVPFNKLFDDDAVRVIRSSPAWIPARRFNRTVKTYLQQPVTFLQEE